MHTHTTPRRFRRRLLVVMTALGLLPLLAWGLASHVLTGRVLSLRPSRLDALLAHMDEELGPSSANAATRAEVAAARINLAQADLARRSLTRLMPQLLVLTLVLSAGLLVAAVMLVGRQLARPIEQLASGMARYGAGDLAHRIPEDGSANPDELQFLVRQFNGMGDELAAQRARIEVSEALAAWQGVARALAHELKNPLTAMRMATGRLARRAENASTADAAGAQGEALALIEKQIDALARMAQSFSAFAKLPAPDLRPAPLAPLVAELCSLYRPVSPVALEHDVPAEITVAADPELLARALGNLVKNAIEASSAGGEAVRVKASRSDAGVRVEITDGGTGIGSVIEGAVLARSLGTTKTAGSGLGLPIAHKILHEHGGALRLEPRAGGGTLASVVLPVRGRS
jgi:two-component system, NtrC family, nitrogen regulation sensor histidine kinase NtrY